MNDGLATEVSRNENFSFSRRKADGSLEEVTSVAIPYNGPEGLAGF
jgi:hypothetical protein